MEAKSGAEEPGSGVGRGTSPAAAAAGPLLRCDYLVVGAGTAGLSFIDTLLSENPSATVVLVDRNLRPGGHWTRAYPFVRLHQPSAFYGVNSLPLGKTRDHRGREAFDPGDRATGAEVVAYYERVVEKFVSGGRVTCFFGAECDGAADEGGAYTIASGGGGATRVRCARLVTVATSVVVPSMRPPPIPVHESANFAPVNELPEAVEGGRYGRFVVIGAGKTGVDAVLELLARGVDQSQIQWIISRDMWYFVSDVMWERYSSFAGSVLFVRNLLEGATIEDTLLAIERTGFVARLDPNGPFPEVSKGAIVSVRELELLRSVEDVVRLGRAVSIGDGDVALERGTLSFSAPRTLFVDCMAEGFYGYGLFEDGFQIFEPGRINLGPLFIVYNPSFSSAIVAYAESHFASDDAKNSIFFPLVGKHCLGNPASLIGGVYAELKTLGALVALRPAATAFLLGSRTNPNSLQNRAGGSLPRFLWGMYGLGLQRGGADFGRKVDDGGFADLRHRFGVGRPVPRRPGRGYLRAIGIGIVGVCIGLALRGVDRGWWRQPIADMWRP